MTPPRDYRFLRQVPFAILAFGIFQFGVYYVLVMFNLQFFECGNQFLDDRSTDFFIFFTLVGLGIAQTIFSLALIKRKKYIGVGYTGLVLNVVTIWFIFVGSSECLDWDHYYKEFSKEEWTKTGERDMRMARYIVNYHFLEGRSKNEVIELMGPGDSGYVSDVDSLLGYSTEFISTQLMVEFHDKKVTRSYLGCYDY